MLPVNYGSHTDYQNFVVSNLRKYYPNPDVLARSTWDIIDRFWNLDLSYTDEKLKNRYSVFGPKSRTPSCMHRSYLLSLDFKVTSLTEWATQLKINPLYAILSGFEFGDTPGVGTFYDFLNRRWLLPVTVLLLLLLPGNGSIVFVIVPLKVSVTVPVTATFPSLIVTSFRMKSFLPEFKTSKLLLDSAHDAMTVYRYCKRKGITPFIDLNEKRGIKVKYKNDFTIGKDGVPVCKEGRRMKQAENTVAHASIPALIPSMEELFTLPQRTIHD